jgi:hypothetical protein
MRFPVAFIASYLLFLAAGAGLGTLAERSLSEAQRAWLKDVRAAFWRQGRWALLGAAVAALVEFRYGLAVLALSNLATYLRLHLRASQQQLPAQFLWLNAASGAVVLAWLIGVFVWLGRS